MVAMHKFGIFGGSFDPIHNGHLITAQSLIKSLKLDKIIFLPAYRSPFKQNHGAKALDRLNMVRLAIADNSNFLLSDYEILKKGTSYTVDTLRYLKAEYHNTELYLIIGADASTDLINWHNSLDLPLLCKIIVASRPGCSSLPDNSIIPMDFVHTPLIDISSTAIREMITNKIEINYLVPAAVIDYIHINNLYSKLRDNSK